MPSLRDEIEALEPCEKCEGCIRKAHVLALVDKHEDDVTIQAALDASVSLQSHYATLLNGWDGGKRLTFDSSADWLERLAKIKENT